MKTIAGIWYFKNVANDGVFPSFTKPVLCGSFGLIVQGVSSLWRNKISSVDYSLSLSPFFFAVKNAISFSLQFGKGMRICYVAHQIIAVGKGIRLIVHYLFPPNSCKLVSIIFSGLLIYFFEIRKIFVDNKWEGNQNTTKNRFLWNQRCGWY